MPGDAVLAPGPAGFRVSVFGDIIGKPGRRALVPAISRVKQEFQPHLVIANGENLAGGVGLNQETVHEIMSAGVDIITGGNHSYRKKEGLKILEEHNRVIRPANFPPGGPGKGYTVIAVQDVRVAVLNLLGRVFLDPVDCPFRSADELLKLPQIAEADFILVDFHAEATSEKVAMGHYLDRRVTAVFGTHTHIPTADERLLPGGTAYISDLGMAGPLDSAIGMELGIVYKRMIMNLPERLEVASGPCVVQGINLSLDKSTRKAIEIKRFDYRIDTAP